MVRKANSSSGGGLLRDVGGRADRMEGAMGRRVLHRGGAHPALRMGRAVVRELRERVLHCQRGLHGDGKGVGREGFAGVEGRLGRRVCGIGCLWKQRGGNVLRVTR